jgi:hypothetical protein
VNRPHAADDYAAIRARMEQLRLEREAGNIPAPSPTRADGRVPLVNRPDTSPKIRSFLLKRGGETGKF